MNHKELIEKLERYLKTVETSASALYKTLLKRLIDRLKEGTISDEELVQNLQSLGFHDIAVTVRRGMYT